VGSRPIKEITAPELLAVLRRVESLGKLETTRRLKERCGHRAQGLGANRVLLDKDTKARTTDDRNFYTDLTRARNAAVIYTNDRQALPKAITRHTEKAAALDVQHQRELQHRGSGVHLGR
jgi:hypothetical protein